MTEFIHRPIDLSPDCLPMVQPLIVPSGYNSHGDFPARFAALRHPELALTWVALSEPDTMIYVMPRIADVWEQQGIDWRAVAMANLRAVDKGRTWTHEKSNAWGDTLWVAMMHEDGLGCSRLLCRDELEETFPAGYQVALPDRSCGMALSLTANASEREDFERMVAGCYTGATTPMLGEILDPDVLLAAR